MSCGLLLEYWEMRRYGREGGMVGTSGTLETWDICDDGDRSAVEQGGRSGFRGFGWDMGHL